MKENYTHMAIVIDKSGSMGNMRNDVIGGFNNLIAEQQKVKGDATISLIHFSTDYNVISDFAPLDKSEKLSRSNFIPEGGTALLDAMGKTLEEVKSKIHKMKENEKPSKVIFVFITDGEENSSKEYTKDRVFEMIADLKSEDRDDKIKWDFVFIGANQDAIQAGGSFGIRANASLTYDASSAGATMAFMSLSKGISSYRSVSDSEYAFSEDDAKKQKDLIDKK